MFQHDIINYYLSWKRLRSTLIFRTCQIANHALSYLNGKIATHTITTINVLAIRELNTHFAQFFHEADIACEH